MTAGRTVNEATLGAWNSALDQEQLARFVDTNHVEVLRGDGDITQVTRHLLAGEHAAWILCHTDGARNIVRAAVTVRGTLRTEVVALDGTGVALTNGGALHVHLLAHGKHISNGHSRASGILASHFQQSQGIRE